MMSDLLFNSKSDEAKLSDDLCSSTIEVDDVDKPIGDTGASGTWVVEPSLQLNQRASSLSLPGESTLRTMDIAELANHCTSETHLYQDGELQHKMYYIELLRRATLQSDQNAWEIVQELLKEIVHGWISQHPRKEEACSLKSEEHFVTQAFARLYQLTVRQQVEFSQLSSALQYLKVSLNGAILDWLRTLSRPRAFPLPAPGDSGEPTVAHSTDAVNVREILSESFPSAREQRLIYLLFHCGLSPKVIVNSYPQEFNDAREISRLRQSIFEQLLH